ncbi:MAG: flavin prenyltransferase UbiX [Planctomycetia bacterium]|nr:flavin prenyltransferase UbiX [Planctomycetia bacterium]
MCNRTIVVAITGASGMAYVVRLMEVLVAGECDIHLIVSPSAYSILAKELNIQLDPEHFDPIQFGLCQNCVSEFFPSGQVHFHPADDFSQSIGSGSFATDGMVICPCSTGTLGCIAAGVNLNLIHRAADVHLKERRKLILVPRETPLSVIHLQNMLKITQAGGILLPAAPAFYHEAQNLKDIVNFVVSRICDQLGVENNLIRRWKMPGSVMESHLNEERFLETTG